MLINMLCLRALYTKMMDDLKDAGMWIEWANELKESHPDVSKYLITSANDRLERSFSESKKMFMDAVKDDKSMMKELIKDHMDSWSMEMKEKIKNY